METPKKEDPQVPPEKAQDPFLENPPRKKAEVEPVYYYSRARRLERASEAVRELNNGVTVRPGLFRALTATRSLAILFVTIVIFTVLGIAASFFSRGNDQIKLGGNAITVSAMTYQGSTFIVLTKTAGTDGGSYTGTVDLAVSPAPQGKDNPPGAVSPISTHRIFFSLNREEDYRFSVPFEAAELLILAQIEKERRSFRVKTD
jgi:hypothetical protein